MDELMSVMRNELLDISGQPGHHCLQYTQPTDSSVDPKRHSISQNREERRETQY